LSYENVFPCSSLESDTKKAKYLVEDLNFLPKMNTMISEILQNKIGIKKAQVILKVIGYWIMSQHLDKITINLRSKEVYNRTLKLMDKTTSMMIFRN